MLKAVLFDIDGTLVDSNDAHARAWVAAFAEQGVEVSFERVRACIGMGGDKLMPAVSGISEDSEQGQRISTRRRAIFTSEFLPGLRAFRDAARLVATVRRHGYTTVVATSAKRDELMPLLRIAGAESLMDQTTSSDDADESKPDPDIVQAALQRANARASEAVMIGDTPYDVEAARRAGVAIIGVRCGGWRDADLQGAAEIYDGPWDLLAKFGTSLLH